MALILITDDAAFARRMTKKILVKQNHTVIEAANGQECLDMIEVHSPDCVLLDLLMPELDGFAVLETLKEKDSKIPVIVLSADIQDSVKDRCINLGAITVVKKPAKELKIKEALELANI